MPISNEPPPGPGSPDAGGDWPARAADLVDTVAALVRDRAIRPVVLVARALVFGLLVVVASTVTAVLLAIAAVRLLTVYAFDGRVWAADFLIGAVFVGGGLVAWSRRGAPKDPAR
ncbi:MAG: hypothetical protein M0Z93_02850 [Actinomycetota bacterium]|jgi:hypothetical protein|nr:hypothetical protein [Actinomycetota bacterium]